METQLYGFPTIKVLFLICSAMLAAIVTAKGVEPIPAQPEGLDLIATPQEGRNSRTETELLDKNADPTDPWFKLPLPPEPRPGYYKFLNDFCLKVLTERCGREIMNVLIGSKTMSNSCCEKLIEMGSKCNSELATALGKFDTYKSYAASILAKSQQIYDQCSKQSRDSIM